MTSIATSITMNAAKVIIKQWLSRLAPLDIGNGRCRLRHKEGESKRRLSIRLTLYVCNTWVTSKENNQPQHVSTNKT